MTHQMPLAMVRAGETATVAGVRAGHGLTRRLADMGVVPRTTLRVINNQMPGPLIIDIKGSRLILGHGMAQKIMVEGFCSICVGKFPIKTKIFDKGGMVK